MSGPGGDWRNGLAYEFFDDLGPDQVAFEFLYYAVTRTTQPSSRNYVAYPKLRILRRSSLNGGCDFAVDPHLRSDQATVIWNAQSNPRMAIFMTMPSGLCDAPGLALASPSFLATSAEGSYLDLLALPPERRALLLGEAAPGALALVLPLDGLFEDRIDTARRLHRLLVKGRATPSTFTAYRRRRLRLALRALDGTLSGADYRGVAEVLFGDRVPRGAAWRDDSLRGQVIRLVRYGLDLMQGGYLDLLRPERRQPKRRRRP